MDTEILNEILNYENQDFFKEYIELLNCRLIHSSMALEIDLGDPDNSRNAIKMNDNMGAFKYLLQSDMLEKTISEEIVVDVANRINKSVYYISDGYRKTGGKYIQDSDVKITEPGSIINEMSKLIYKYNNDWNEMDIYEREARFHIDFIIIHPFEDGNGRTGRTILNYNLLKFGRAPVIITRDLIEYYHEYIKNKDYEGMANLFRIQATKENEIIKKLYFETLKENKHK